VPAQLEAILFNDDPMSPVNGLNLRRDAWQPVAVPEWRRTVVGAGSFAAYAIAEARRAMPTVRAQLRRSDPSLVAVDVRAIDPSGTNVLGSLRSRRITFRPDGTSRFERFTLTGARLLDAGVGVHTVTWRWQWRPDAQQPWSSIADTTHTVYTVLTVPGPPWTQQPFGQANTQLPWTAVLEHACRWASSAETLDEAAARITEAVFALGPDVIEYGCAVLGSTQYALPYFQCMAFLDRLSGGFGRGRYVNCTDCATIVSTFANILGCELWQSTMQGNAPFALNETLAVGTSSWRTACDWRVFRYHEVAWKFPCTADEAIFDACLLVDSDPDPTRPPHSGVLPINMRFGRPGDGDYRDRLAAPLGRADCRPQPTTRQQRLVV
jgi:hypothetical protein